MFQGDKQLQTTTTIAHPCLPKWRARIDAAERRGSFDWVDQGMAADWKCCLIGEAGRTYPALERNSVGAPTDRELQKLGAEFGSFINPVVRAGGKRFIRARQLLTAIEARLNEIFVGKP
jgi:hypothetical protein